MILIFSNYNLHINSIQSVYLFYLNIYGLLTFRLAIDHSSIRLKRLTIQLVFSELDSVF